ncbi:hypothetical protein NP233_g386 [Leucocoprinus birnbaumii]|uniref:Hydrophobin n=1 Tax=Leucocoprinus birnbaumii TaxID=56174 RepID=A0AAD5Z0A6_9AGAR|nr:hypothetical protein NP233_g386 [Leucocoprinus birnbaumii]
MRFAAALTLALPAFVAATAIPRQSGSCNTGSIQCCNQIQQATPQTANLLSGLLGIALGSLTLPIGREYLLSTALPSILSALEATPALLNLLAALAIPSAVSLAWAAAPSTSTSNRQQIPASAWLSI